MTHKKNTNPYISGRNPFDEIKALFSKEYGFVDVVRPFMVNKILSFQGITCPLAIKVNEKLNGMPKYLFNMILNCGVPKRSNVKLIFPKRKIEEETILREKVSDTFCANHYHSNQIIDILKRMGTKPAALFGLEKGE